MPKRTRRSARPIRRDASVPQRETTTDRDRTTARVRSRGSAAQRAVGAPSPALERAAAWERGYVVKDFRRLGITTIAILILLVLSGFVVNTLLG